MQEGLYQIAVMAIDNGDPQMASEIARINFEVKEKKKKGGIGSMDFVFLLLLIIFGLIHVVRKPMLSKLEF